MVSEFSGTLTIPRLQEYFHAGGPAPRNHRAAPPFPRGRRHRRTAPHVRAVGGSDGGGGPAAARRRAAAVKRPQSGGARHGGPRGAPLLAAAAGRAGGAGRRGQGERGGGHGSRWCSRYRAFHPPAARFPRVVPLSWPRCCIGWLQGKAGARGFVRALPCPAEERRQPRFLPAL